MISGIDSFQTLYQHLAAAGETGNVDSYMAVLAASAEIHPPFSSSVRGRPALRAWLNRFFGTYRMKEMKLTLTRFETSAQLATLTYRATGRHAPVGEGEAVPFDQKYVDTWRKQADGSWKIVIHSWNSNIPGPTIWESLRQE